VKVLILLALGFCLALSARAQASDATYSPEQLDQMLGPIALYPDPLVALILPASTVPSDLTLAANYLAANGAPGGIDAQPWDPSVKGLAHYPDVLKWMSENLDWTQALGAAFAQQPADVMKSIQQLRVQARAAGTLVDTPQQKVDVEGDDIRIIPAQPDTIYVPEYDSSVVYDTPIGYSGPFITFGVGYPAGVWLGYQLDWDDFGIWVGPWSRGWGYNREWRRPGSGGGSWRAWRPDPRHSRELIRNSYRPEARLPSPGVINGYRGPALRPGTAPHPVASRAPTRAPSRPDYRGRPAVMPRSPSPAPSSSLFGGYGRGAQTREFSGRGQRSRSAPVRAMPSRGAAPSRAAPPSHSAPSSHGSSGDRERH
jgi:hypothetical protein